MGPRERGIYTEAETRLTITWAKTGLRPRQDSIVPGDESLGHGRVAVDLASHRQLRGPYTRSAVPYREGLSRARYAGVGPMLSGAQVRDQNWKHSLAQAIIHGKCAESYPLRWPSLFAAARAELIVDRPEARRSQRYREAAGGATAAAAIFLRGLH